MLFRSILSTLTITRIINLVKLFLSYCFSILTGNVRIYGMPSFLSVEPANFCNLDCTGCLAGKSNEEGRKIPLDTGLFKKILEELKPFLTHLNLYNQGEPLLHPDIFEMIKLARQKRIFTCLSTNAQVMDEKNAGKIVDSGLGKIIISLDGTTQETYEKYRVGGNIEKVIAGTRAILDKRTESGKNTPLVVLQFIVFSFNEHQITEVEKLGRELGVDKVEIKTAQIVDMVRDYHLIPDNQKYSRYRKIHENNFVIKSKLKNRCWKMWSSSVVSSDGNVFPCCFDKKREFRMGGVTEDTFKEIWENENYTKFRKRILKGRKDVGICLNCNQGLTV